MNWYKKSQLDDSTTPQLVSAMISWIIELERNAPTGGSWKDKPLLEQMPSADQLSITFDKALPIALTALHKTVDELSATTIQAFWELGLNFNSVNPAPAAPVNPPAAPQGVPQNEFPQNDIAVPQGNPQNNLPI